MMASHILSLLIFLPLVGGLLLYVFPWCAEKHVAGAQRARLCALVVSLSSFIVSLVVLARFDPSDTGYQMVEHLPWIPSFGVSYYVGVDGLSVLLVVLTAFLTPIVVLASKSVERSVRAYLFQMLMLETAMIGTLLALDVFLFYIFWELMLAPMYFIIGIWGGKRRIYASMKFVLYTVSGSVLMLVGLLYVVWAYSAQHGGAVSFALQELIAGTSLSSTEQLWLFAAFALAFGIKVPIFPLHTWLPDAHVEAPTGGSVILAGVLLKMGLYGFLRFAFPLFPFGAVVFSPYLAVLAVIGIIYGALVAWAQADMKKLVAYSSVSHLGYCVLGLVALDSISVTGSLYQMLNHAISTGALFLLVGVLYDRKHTRLIADYGGLASKTPVFAFFFLVFTLSSIALPLTNGFVGEFLILLGSFRVFPVLTAIAVLGVILGAIYMLTLYMRVIFGELDTSKNGDLTDVNSREILIFAPLAVLVFVMGIYPQPFLRTMEPSVRSYVQQLEARMNAGSSRAFVSSEYGKASRIGIELAQESMAEPAARDIAQDDVDLLGA